MIDHALPSVLSLRSQSVAATETAEKIASSLIPRNPLISLDSDERIQGPRKSNSGFRLFSEGNR